MAKKINLQPMGTRVLIQPLDQESKTASGLVVAVGDDEEIKLKVNDKVLFAKYSGTEFKVDGTEYLLLESTDVLAKFLN